MELIGTAINAAVVAGVGLIVAWFSKGRFEAQDRRMDRLERRMEGFQASLDGLRSEFTRSLDAFRSDFVQSLEGLRSDLTQVALAVGVRRRTANE